MNTDIRLAISFKGHRKRKKLSRIVGDKSDSYLIDLWITVATDCPDGVLKGWDETDIADACGFIGNASEIVNALLESKWLHRKNDVFTVHDWQEHQVWASKASQRSKSARIAAAKKWGVSETPTGKTRAERMKAARAKSNHTNGEWEEMKLFFKTCVKCDGKNGLKHADRDHIVPVYMEGCHGIRNIQPLCAKCNASKSSETIDHRVLFCNRHGVEMPEKWGKNACEITTCSMRDVCMTHAVTSPPILSLPILSLPNQHKTNTPKKLKHLLPDGYALSDNHKNYAITKKINVNEIEDIFEGFKIYHRQKGSKNVDWYAAWQTWVRNHIKFKAEKEIKDDKYARILRDYEEV